MRFPMGTRSRTPSSAVILSGIAVAIILTSPAAAVTIDGSLDAEYGIARSTQTTQTSFDDTSPGSEGAELDEAYGFVSGGILHLFFSGNLFPFTTEPLLAPDQLEIFIDCASGGQNRLRSDNPSVGSELKLSALAGLTFDSDFSPDFWFELSTLRGTRLQTFYSDLPAESGGAGYFMGRNGAADGGTLSGGNNPYGVRVAMNGSNIAGVTAGCGPSSGAGVATGYEWEIPLAAIGNPTGSIKVCALVVTQNAPQVSNQVLGPVPPGTCSLGAPAGVDFSTITGEQYFLIDFAVPVRQASMGFLKSLYAR